MNSKPKNSATCKQLECSNNNPNQTGMRIALIGPGILPIPPTGWGAVETVIWNLNSNLRDLGHQVLIVNTADRQEAESQIEAFLPNLIWLHYDEYICWLPDYDSRTTFWLTSHFAYLEQYSKGWIERARRSKHLGSTPAKAWKLCCLGFRPLSHRLYAMASYFRILAEIANVGSKINLRLVCLSPAIAEALQPTGLETAVLPNGAENDLIRYNADGGNGRALCLGKIEPRKRQVQLLHIDKLDFVGPVKDRKFPADSPRYKGIWDREQVRDKLTDYSVLVLLSDGEAHALVICEALLAGLSLVVSSHAAGNLDPSWPVAKVLSPHEFKEPQVVQQAIEGMLGRAESQRQDARDIGLNFFSLQAQKQNLSRLVKG